MNKRTYQIIIFIAVALGAALAAFECSENPIASIYNNLTEQYRNNGNAPDSIQDSLLTVKAVDFIENKPMGNATVKFTSSTSGTSLTGVTDKFGAAYFALKTLAVGIYHIEISLTAGTKIYYGSGNFYIHKNNNPAIIIYLSVNTITIQSAQ
jgi:hypothetical protein